MCSNWCVLLCLALVSLIILLQPTCAKLQVGIGSAWFQLVALFQVASGVKVIVQPSKNRIFPNLAYVEAGAVVQEDLSEACVILAVKEVPIPLLIPNRTYCFFSHTKKAQPANMPLLDSLLAKGIRMVDYEAITEGGIRNAKRLVAFGRFAGKSRRKRSVFSCDRVCIMHVYVCLCDLRRDRWHD